MLLNNVKYYLHHLAWLYMHGNLPDKVITHKNGNKHDTRIENLIETDQSTILLRSEKLKRCQTNFRGVSKYNKDKYRFRKMISGKLIEIVGFSTEEEAYEAGMRKLKELEGQIN